MERKELRTATYLPWLLGPVATTLALLAHVVSGGAVPWPPALLALAALLSMAASMLARLRLPVWALLLLCGLTQQLLHWAFLLFSDVPAVPQSSGHSHASLPFPVPGAAVQAVGHLQELMLVTHVAAALLTALIMATAGRRLARRPAMDASHVRESARDRRH
jgi:hypothetical protein